MFSSLIPSDPTVKFFIYFGGLIIGLKILIALLEKRKRGQLRYKSGTPLLTNHEARLGALLLNHIPGFLCVSFKVGLADLAPAAEGATWRNSFKKVQCKHVDFVLVDRTTFKPVLVIELQDRTHNRRDRQESDALKRLALGQAGIPLLEIHPHHSDEKRLELLNQHLPWAS